MNEIELARMRQMIDRISMMDIETIKDAFRKIIDSERGSFLSSFAIAFLHADPQNELILLPAAIALIAKYNLIDTEISRSE